jgi:hypothetical protein
MEILIRNVEKINWTETAVWGFRFLVAFLLIFALVKIAKKFN